VKEAVRIKRYGAQAVQQRAGAPHGVADPWHDTPRMVAQRARIAAAFGPVAQREGGLEDEDPLQARAAGPAQHAPAAAQPNDTGMPNQLKAGIEALSGMDMSDVRVHRNSDQPAQLNALAYAQGSDIHLAPGQEQHLPHEAWHVVQQRQGRVQATVQMAGLGVNDDVALEGEADVMGERAASGPVQLQGDGKRQDLTPSGAAVRAETPVARHAGAHPLHASPRQVAQRVRIAAAFGPGVLQARWVVREDGSTFDAPDGHALAVGERWADESPDVVVIPSAVGNADASAASSSSPPLVSSLFASATAVALQMRDIEEAVTAVPVPDHVPDLELGLGTAPNLTQRGSRSAQQNQDQVIALGAPPAQRRTVVVARVLGGLAAPLLDASGLLIAAIGTTLDATGKGPAFLAGVGVTVVTGIKAIANDIVKHEDHPRDWPMRLLHTAGALVPLLLTIPIGIAGTTYGADHMNVPAAVWVSFVFGLLAVFVVHLIKLLKWCDR
jgi:hypothetical protein